MRWVERITILLLTIVIGSMWYQRPTWVDHHMGCLVTFKELLDQRDVAISERVGFERKILELSFDNTGLREQLLRLRKAQKNKGRRQ